MKKEINFKELPSLPGCYLYKDKENKIIYVGKAKNLKKRVSSYFSKNNLDKKTEKLVSNIVSLDFIVTKSEIEAFLLEDSLIKKHNPKYNINLKDSKSYAYIGITQEKFPRLIIERNSSIKKKQESGKLFGPFISAESRTQILDLVNKTFKLRTCKKLPKKKCIRYDLGICSAPCINKIKEEDYSKDLENATYVLEGKNKELIKNLDILMNQASKNQDYERAIILRNQKKAIEYLNNKQNMERQKSFNEDIINFVVKEEKVYLIVFNIYKGTLLNKQEFTFEYFKDFFEEFLSRFYSKKEIPKKIVVPLKVSESIQNFLNTKKGSKVIIKVPKKGELKELLDLVKKNIEVQFFRNMNQVEELKKVLNLNKNPEIIECFDISHLGGTNVVASMVQFKDGEPNKREYRKFKIKSFQGNDDFRAMNEVVKRRYKNLKDNDKKMPDLILIDGGQGQLNSAKKAIEELEIKIPIISLAKKFEEIYTLDKIVPISLPKNNKARILVEKIRNEAHRFAISYQRNLRNKTYFTN